MRNIGHEFRTPWVDNQGNLTAPIQKRLAGTIVLDATGPNGVQQFGGVRFADKFGSVQAAIDDLPPTGGEVYLPTGIYEFSTGITITKPTLLRGAGTATNGPGLGATVLRYTGNGVAITVSGIAARGTVLQDFTLDNTGTGTVGIDIYSTLDVRLRQVTVWAAIAFSIAGLRIGNSASSVSSISLHQVYSRANVVGLLATNVIAHLVLVDTHLIQNSTHDLILGDVTNGYTVENFESFGSTFEGAPNTSSVLILRASKCHFAGGYFECDGSGYCLEIPSTAVMAHSITLDGCGLYGNAWSHGSTYATGINLASGSLGISNSYCLGFANPSYAVHNQASGSVTLLGNKYDATGMIGASDFTGVFEFGDNVAGVPVTRCGYLTVPALAVPSINNLAIYVSNADAMAGGLAVGDLYRSGGDPDQVCVVH